MNSRTWCLGDIHGSHKALKQVLERSGFNYENDILISLGDICDGWSETCECFEELLKIKNLIPIIGNHDQWFLQYCLSQPMDFNSWQQHGGKATLQSYQFKTDLLQKHVEFLKNSLNYYIDDLNRVFVHAGISDLKKPLNDQTDYCWNRTFFENAMVWNKQNHFIEILLDLKNNKKTKEWFIGHTPVQNFKHLYKSTLPIKMSNINFIDTGSAFKGVLTIMDVNNYEYFQSDIVKTLHPDEKGRNKQTYNQEIYGL